jgi:prophage antirepressor-like protein
MNMLSIKNENLNCDLTYTNLDGSIWFKGKDVAQYLAYKDTDKAVRNHVDDDDKCKLGGMFNPAEMAGSKKNHKNTIMINESGLYCLILRSKLPSAKEFKKWVTREVLPNIRKTGTYVLPTDEFEERRLNLEEKRLDMDVQKQLTEMFENDIFDDPKIKSMIKDKMINHLSGNIPTIENKFAKDVSDLCKEIHGFYPNFSQLRNIGTAVMMKYVDKYNQKPQKYEKYVNGNMRKVNCYLLKHEKMMIKVIKELDL